MMFFISHYYK